MTDQEDQISSISLLSVHVYLRQVRWIRLPDQALDHAAMAADMPDQLVAHITARDE